MTLADQIAAARDNNLLARIVAAAQQKGIENPQAWAEANRGRIVATDVNGTVIADVHAFALTEKGQPAGTDPAYVTDAQILAAVEAVNTPS